jgi:cytosine/adenosine deaminase-related metal-dependent hydrolase
MASLSASKLLLSGGTLLVHDEADHVIPIEADLLVEGSTISKIQKDIQIPLGEEKDVKVIDCKDKIISPGFISTHHHLYQTQFKGSHANHTLLEYFPRGNYTASLYSLEDTFWGQLSGAMEAIDAGTTTVVDHSSVNLSPEYCKHPSSLRSPYLQLTKDA